MLSAYYIRLYSELTASDVTPGLSKLKADLTLGELHRRFAAPIVDASYFAFVVSLVPEDVYAGPVDALADLEREVARRQDLAVLLHLVAYAIRMRV